MGSAVKLFVKEIQVQSLPGRKESTKTNQPPNHRTTEHAAHSWHGGCSRLTPVTPHNGTDTRLPSAASLGCARSRPKAQSLPERLRAGRSLRPLRSLRSLAADGSVTDGTQPLRGGRCARGTTQPFGPCAACQEGCDRGPP